MTTTPDSAAQGRVTVIQADREAAQRLCEYAGFAWSADHLDMALQATEQAFARHRLASSPPAQQAGVEDALRVALEEIAKRNGRFSRQSGLHATAEHALRAVKAYARAALRPSTDAAAQPTDAVVGELFDALPVERQSVKEAGEALPRTVWAKALACGDMIDLRHPDDGVRALAELGAEPADDHPAVVRIAAALRAHAIRDVEEKG